MQSVRLKNLDSTVFLFSTGLGPQYFRYKNNVWVKVPFTVMGQEPDTALTGSRCRSVER